MEELSCTCFLGMAPCSHCERSSECMGCGKVFYDEGRTAVCPPCQDQYRWALQRHELDCLCAACVAFTNEDDAESGFKAAIPIMIEMENR